MTVFLAELQGHYASLLVNDAKWPSQGGSAPTCDTGDSMMDTHLALLVLLVGAPICAAISYASR